MSSIDIKSVARGTGALKCRWGVRKADAVRFAVIEYPYLAGHEDDVRAGWSAEYRSLRGR